MSRVVDGVIPPQGFHYRSPTGYRVPATGEALNFPDLVEKMVKYRLENHLDVGNAEADAEDYICTNFPNICGIYQNPGNFQAHSVLSAAIGRPVDFINGWVNGLLNNIAKVELVTEAEANSRAVACRKCPYNQEWRNGCGPCVSTAQRGLGTVRQSKDVQNPDDMRYCGLHRIETRTAVWLHRSIFGPVNAPSHCWLV